MKVLVTGASGKIGQAICAKLLAQDHEVIGIDLKNSPLSEKCYHHVLGSLTNKALLKSALADCECIVHSAVSVGINYAQQSEKAFDTNVYGTYILYDAAKEYGIQKVILLSSAPVDKQFPELSQPYKWTSNKEEDHAYDLTKRLQEEIAQDYSDTFSIRTVILRIGHVVDGTKKQSLDGESLSGFDYCSGGWVDKNDVANASLLAIKCSEAGVFNVIGSHQAQVPFDINRTTEVLGWPPEFRF